MCSPQVPVVHARSVRGRREHAAKISEHAAKKSTELAMRSAGCDSSAAVSAPAPRLAELALIVPHGSASGQRPWPTAPLEGRHRHGGGHLELRLGRRRAGGRAGRARASASDKFMALATFDTCYAALEEAVKAGESQAAAVPAARDALKAAMSVLLLEVAAGDAAAATAVDAVLCTWRPEPGKYAKSTGPLPPLREAALVKGSFLAALKVAAHYPAILAMPQLMEAIRKLLCGAPAKGVYTFLVEDLCKDIEGCTDAVALAAVHEVLRVHMQAEGRLKKELMGFTLGAEQQKSVSTAANKAAKRLEVAKAASACNAAAEAKAAAATAAKNKAAEFAALNAK